MVSSLRLGQFLRGHNGAYTIGKQLQETVWLAKIESNQSVIVRSVHRFRLQNERDVLKHFQYRTPFIRPLVDELVEPSDPPAIIKYVARGTLEALKVLHEDNFVHTGLCNINIDTKPDNVLLNHGQGKHTLFEVQLADCGSTVPSDSAYARDGDLIGAPIRRSPEAHFQNGWGTATDIWSYGALLVTLVYGDNFFLFKPDVPADHDEYELKILQRQCEFFGPFPLTYRGICPQETLDMLAYITQSIPPEKKKPFARISEKEVSKEDKEFILKIMTLDPRDRPSAAELLQDECHDKL
ncbi:kinase-like protein [Aspergillus campestris IBT 28561]|uniref:Kinase-like protein n=1 Tax=Aspergillus campestris (strain IBT 28561) TaxID=1392248 RepID=A0A2I1D2M2_ASPC2|nr:kinase-like protein [Aspergillus campestris IBT 28561]PKY04130.1 kinase-like protein [Aspergillus campestris IBT 28561]